MPINLRIAKTQVAEKNPHHQHDQQHKKQHEDEEISDEMLIEANEDSQATSPQEITSKTPAPNPHHNLDIEV